MSGEDLLNAIEEMLDENGTVDSNLAALLDTVLKHYECVTGTIHVLDPGTGTLKLSAQRGVPEAIMARVREIPIGKGMAGLAAERREPVQVCDLQTDDSGVAKSGAKLTGMQGSIAFPLLEGPDLRGTMGVSKPGEYEFSQAETELLMKIGRAVARRLS